MSEPSAGLFTTPEMASVFSSEAHVRQMLRFEAALAWAEAECGIIPHAAALMIADGCRVESFDVASLYREAVLAGTPVIPLVRMLNEQVADDARAFVHWGATSQDVIDTALVLQIREGFDLLLADLLRIGSGCAALAHDHRHTLMAGRTLMQQALPIPFGLKAARWLSVITHQIQALQQQRQSLSLQFGGAVGTLAALGDRGLHVAEVLAADLALVLPDLPWHAERDRMAGVAAALGVTAGAVAKIANDLVLLAQTEIGEVSEATTPGKGGSSAMPHKHNPVDAMLALAAARLALGQVPIVLAGMLQEHERAAGGWQAEWEALPNLFRYTGGTVAHVAQAISGLTINVQRMQANLNQSGGLLMAESLTMVLASRLGRPEAQRLVGALCARAVEHATTLHEAALNDTEVHSVLSTEQIAVALDPSGYLGSADTMIERALASYRMVSGGA